MEGYRELEADDLMDWYEEDAEEDMDFKVP